MLNVREPDAISAKVTKNWNDNSDNDGKRPHKLTFMCGAPVSSRRIRRT